MEAASIKADMAALNFLGKLVATMTVHGKLVAAGIKVAMAALTLLGELGAGKIAHGNLVPTLGKLASRRRTLTKADTTAHTDTRQNRQKLQNNACHATPAEQTDIAAAISAMPRQGREHATTW